MSKKIDDKGLLSREEASVKVQLMELEELKSLDTEAESSGDGSWAQRAGQKDGQTNCKLGKKRPSRRSLEGQRVEVTDQREDHMGKDEKARLGPGRASQTGKETENKQVRKEQWLGTFHSGREMPITDLRRLQSPKKNGCLGYLSLLVLLHLA